MKKEILLAFVVGFLLALAMGATREAVYRQWGPLQMEAVLRVIVQEFNRNRDWHSKPAIDLQDVVNAVQQELDTLPQYQWMTNEIPKPPTAQEKAAILSRDRQATN